MTFCCHGDTHIYIGEADICECGKSQWGYTYPEIVEKYFPNQMDACPICDQPESQHIVYPNGDTQCPPMASQINVPPAAMTGYAPPGYKPAKPKVDEDVPLSRLKAAVDAKALYLSADGKRGYRDDRGNPEVCFWDAEAGKFDSWWWCEAVANDAVKL